MARTRFTLLVLCLGALVLVPPAAAGAQQQPTPAAAQTFMQARDAEVRAILHRPARSQAQRDERTNALTAALHALLDYDELARRSLGDHFAVATPVQRTEFTDLLRQLVERSYKKNLDNTMSYEVRYLGESATDGGRLVRTSARSRTNGREPPVNIDYSLHQVGPGWKVFDIATDGVSLVHNYRSQFHRIIQRDGFEGLLRRMRDRLANPDGDM